jgi:hypothetical protein
MQLHNDTAYSCHLTGITITVIPIGQNIMQSTILPFLTRLSLLGSFLASCRKKISSPRSNLSGDCKEGTIKRISK